MMISKTLVRKKDVNMLIYVLAKYDIFPSVKQDFWRRGYWIKARIAEDCAGEIMQDIAEACMSPIKALKFQH